MRFLVLWTLILFCNFLHAEDETLVFSSEDRNNFNEKNYSRFEITADYIVNWETSGEGVFCPSIAGVFQGSITPEIHKKMMALALKAIQSEAHPSITLVPSDDSTSNNKLYVIINGKTTKANIKKGGSDFNNFYSALMEIKRSLKPKQAFILKAKKMNKELQLKFELLGDGPTQLLFDSKLSHQFMMVPNIEMSFANKKMPRNVVLTKKNPSYTLTLKSKSSFPSGQIYYSNSSSRKYDSPIQEVQVCADVGAP